MWQNRTTELAGGQRGSIRLIIGVPLPFLPCHETPMLHAAMMFPMSSGLYLPEAIRRFRKLHHLRAPLKANKSTFQLMPKRARCSEGNNRSASESLRESCMRPCVCPWVCLSDHLSFSCPVCLPVNISICLSCCLPKCLSVAHVCLPDCLNRLLSLYVSDTA